MRAGYHSFFISQLLEWLNPISFCYWCIYPDLSGVFNSNDQLFLQTLTSSLVKHCVCLLLSPISVYSYSLIYNPKLPENYAGLLGQSCMPQVLAITAPPFSVSVDSFLLTMKFHLDIHHCHMLEILVKCVQLTEKQFEDRLPTPETQHIQKTTTYLLPPSKFSPSFIQTPGAGSELKEDGLWILE